MPQTSRTWKFVFWGGFAIFGIGASADLLAERWQSYSLSSLFLGALLLGSITLLVAYIGLALTGSASSAITGGSLSLFLAFFVPMSFEHWGGSLNIHGSAGSMIMLFGTVAGVGGLLSLAIGIVRMVSSPE